MNMDRGSRVCDRAGSVKGRCARVRVGCCPTKRCRLIAIFPSTQFYAMFGVEHRGVCQKLFLSSNNPIETPHFDHR